LSQNVRDALEKDTRHLNLLSEFEAQNKQLVELDKKNKQLKLDCDLTLTQNENISKDSLEKETRFLNLLREFNTLNIQLVELDKKYNQLKLEHGVLQVSKAQLKKKMQETSYIEEEKYKVLVKQIRDLEKILENERSQTKSALEKGE
jgi:hypothetical protein